MPGPSRKHLSDLYGVTRAALDATMEVTTTVEAMHGTIQRRPSPVGRAADSRPRGIARWVYRAIKVGVRLLARGLDASVGRLPIVAPEGRSAPARDSLVAALNGVFGDHLARTGNPLALDMSLRYRGRRVDPADPAAALAERDPTGKLLVLVHGLCMNDRQWTMKGHNHGRALADELGYTPLYVRYNSGLRVVRNGRSLSELLETTVDSWPEPVEEVVIVGYSMGGLVARSAYHHGRRVGHAWPARLAKLIFLGTPHHGTALERAGHWLNTVMHLSPYSAPLARLAERRSEGITDLRHGSVTDEPKEAVPLPEWATCYAMGGNLAKQPGALCRRVLGDGTVPLDSALGRHPDPEHALPFTPNQQWVVGGVGHLGLLSRPEVYEKLWDWLKDTLQHGQPDRAARLHPPVSAAPVATAGSIRDWSSTAPGNPKRGRWPFDAPFAQARTVSEITWWPPLPTAAVDSLESLDSEAEEPPSS